MKKGILGAVKRLGREVKQYKKDALLSPAFTTLCVILEIYIPYLTASIIDDGIAVGNMAHVAKIGVVMIIMALLAALWVNNVMLVVGVKIDAEVLRAKELQVGMDSERDIQAPPRSSAAAQQYANIEQGLEAAGRSIKDAAGD